MQVFQLTKEHIFLSYGLIKTHLYFSAPKHFLFYSLLYTSIYISVLPNISFSIVYFIHPSIFQCSQTFPFLQFTLYIHLYFSAPKHFLFYSLFYTSIYISVLPNISFSIVYFIHLSIFQCSRTFPFLQFILYIYLYFSAAKHFLLYSLFYTSIYISVLPNISFSIVYFMHLSIFQCSQTFPSLQFTLYIYLYFSAPKHFLLYSLLYTSIYISVLPNISFSIVYFIHLSIFQCFQTFPSLQFTLYIYLYFSAPKHFLFYSLFYTSIYISVLPNISFSIVYFIHLSIFQCSQTFPFLQFILYIYLYFSAPKHFLLYSLFYASIYISVLPNISFSIVYFIHLSIFQCSQTFPFLQFILYIYLYFSAPKDFLLYSLFYTSIYISVLPNISFSIVYFIHLSIFQCSQTFPFLQFILCIYLYFSAPKHFLFYSLLYTSIYISVLPNISFSIV